MTLDEQLLDDADRLAEADPSGSLRALAGAGAQVRTALNATADAGLERVTGGGRPRAVVVASLGTGVAAWVGADSQGADLGLGQLVGAGLNIAPPSVFILGVGALAFGLWPRRAIAVTYGLVVWSFVVEVFASVSDRIGWLRDTSPLLHIAPVPASDANVGAALWLLALGVAAGAAGTVAFTRRDLTSA